MDITVGKMIPTGRGPSHQTNSFLNGKHVSPKERRKDKSDRRKAVRAGIIVSLGNDQRSPRDRRKRQTTY